GGLGTGDVLEQDGELVAAEAPHQVLGPYARAQTLGHLDKKVVADLVPEAVVDQLEAVQVEEQDGDGDPPAPHPGQAPPQAVVEGGAVGQGGQVVVVGVVGQLLLEVLAVGDVVEVGHDAGDARIAEEVHHIDVGPTPVAVAVAGAQLDPQ